MSDRVPTTPTDLTPDPSDADLAPADGDRRPASRRALLRAAGLVALAGGGVSMAACSADAEVGAPATSPAAPSSPASSAAPSSASASPSASAPASPSASASASAAVPEGPAVAASKVPVGSGVILDDADYVITQPTKGEFKAFSKICTHNRCPVTEISGKDIICKCHNSRFSIEDGSVTNPPATKGLPEAEVTVAGGQVVVTA